MAAQVNVIPIEAANMSTDTLPSVLDIEIDNSYGKRGTNFHIQPRRLQREKNTLQHRVLLL